MNLLYIFTIVIVLSAAFAYINERFIKFPSSIGLMILALGLSLGLLLAGKVSSEMLVSAKSFVGSLDFSDALLNFMLSFLLFAGGMHAEWRRLKNARASILTYATVGVVLSTFVIGSLLYFLGHLFEIQLPYIHCLLFGALISPTDPIAVMGILKKVNLPQTTEIKIVGESLFNDGIGVVLFVTLLGIAHHGVDQEIAGDIALLITKEVGGGILLGFILGLTGFRLLKSIDHYQTEVMISIALVMGGSLVANSLHFSGPLAMVIAGVFIGNPGRLRAMSDTTSDYMFKFWEMVDEIMNAALFVLIGLELLVVPFKPHFIWMGLLAAPLVPGVRYMALRLISFVFRFKEGFNPATLAIMTWGGLRGGISIALAFTVPAQFNRNLILSITYIVVLFSIIIQGLTIEPFIRKMLKK